MAVCGAYSIRPYTIDLKNGDFSIRSATGVAVCGAYAIRPYPTGRKFIGVLVRFYSGNKITAIFSDTRVGAYCILPTNGHYNGRMNGKLDKILIVRVGAYCIRPTNGHANSQMNGKMDKIFIVRVGAY